MQRRKLFVTFLLWFSVSVVLAQLPESVATKSNDEDPTSTEVYWARFYDLKTQQPVFAGGQDGVLYSTFSEMAKNNKVGYDYFTTRPRDIISKEVERWKKRIKS